MDNLNYYLPVISSQKEQLGFWLPMVEPLLNVMLIGEAKLVSFLLTTVAERILLPVVLEVSPWNKVSWRNEKENKDTSWCLLLKAELGIFMVSSPTIWSTVDLALMDVMSLPSLSTELTVRSFGAVFVATNATFLLEISSEEFGWRNVVECAAILSNPVRILDNVVGFCLFDTERTVGLVSVTTLVTSMTSVRT